MPEVARNAEELFRLVVDEAREFAIFLVDSEGRITSWNRGAERIFGWREEEVLHQHFGMLFTAPDRDLHIPERELVTARETGRAADTRWHLRSDGTLIFADGVTTVLRSADGSLIGYSKIARDITERIRMERRLAAQLALTNLLTTAQPLAETARRVMQAVCENLGWDLGVLWQLNDATGTLGQVDLWATEGIDARAVAESKSELARGEGFPGLVWESEKPLWITDFETQKTFPRAKLFAGMGIHAALGFPIVHEGHVLGVMEFFSRTRREPEQALMPILALIGAQIGDYFERHRTAEALRTSEARYRVISDTATDAIFTMDGHGNILFANPAVETIFGHKPEAIIGKPLEVIVPERLRERHRQGVARYLQTRKKNIPWAGVQLPGLHADGHEFPVELSFGFYDSPEGVVFSGFARDITDRELAARELRESLEHEQQARSEAEAAQAQLERRADEETSFRHLASALTGAVEMEDVLHEITNRATLVTRADGVYVERIIQPSRSVEVVSTFGRGAPPRGTCVDYPGSLTEEIMKVRAPVIIADMRGFGRAMAPYLAAQCSDCEFLVTPLIADEEPLGALVLLNSRVSGRTFHEGDIDRARTLGDLASLALRRVRLMEQEREAREKAEAAVRVRDETLGIVSHDLRNPLTTIALSAELLPGSSPDEQGEHVSTILAATRQMQRLIQDLLDVARVESGRLSVRKLRIDPSALAHQICDANTPLAGSRGQQLVCEVPPLPEVEADRDRIVQVFGNLIGNALKFTPEGGEIVVRGYERGDRVVFEVRDTGAGLPDSDLGQVFKPYWQAKKTAHMGAGLGLAIVRGIIEAHDGEVSASNDPAGGAVFTFTLPKAK